MELFKPPHPQKAKINGDGAPYLYGNMRRLHARATIEVAFFSETFLDDGAPNLLIRRAK